MVKFAGVRQYDRGVASGVSQGFGIVVTAGMFWVGLHVEINRKGKSIKSRSKSNKHIHSRPLSHASRAPWRIAGDARVDKEVHVKFTAPS